jgi:hypothetical protein
MHQPHPALPEIGVGLHGNSLNRVTMDGSGRVKSGAES